MFDSLAEKLNVPEDQIRLLILMLSALPLGLFNYLLKSPKVRLWYGLISGFLLQYLMYGLDCLHIVLATSFTFLFIRFLGRKLSAFWVLSFTVMHLSILHIYRMLNDWGGWKLDSTTIYMMSICKFSAMAFSYEDGGAKDEDLKSSYFKAKKIVSRPSLLETFSYVFYYPSAVMGPSFEFADFINFIHTSNEYHDIPVLKALHASLQELLKSIVNLLSVVFLFKHFDFNYCTTKEYADESVLYKFFFLSFAMFIQRTKYYGAWKMSQASVMLCGLGYSSSGKFDKVESCIVREIELEANPRKRIQYWNRTVHLWLKYYLFLRLLNVNKKPFRNNRGLASLVTFMVSAFWHGFYPIYYVFFFLFFVLEQLCTILEEDFDVFGRLRRKGWAVNFAFAMLTQLFCNYLGIIFVLIDFSKAWQFTKSVYCLPPVALLLGFLVLRQMSIGKRSRVSREKKERELTEMIKTTPGNSGK